MIKTDLTIIGGGPSGIFASFQAGMLGMQSAIIDNQVELGGQCITLYPEKPIYDIPAYRNIIAKDLVHALLSQADQFNPQKYLQQQAVALRVDRTSSHPFRLTTSAGNIIDSKIIIIAAGAGSFGPNKPPINNIESYEGKSVYYSVLDPKKFWDKRIVIAGGGDSALDWAIDLAPYSKVSVVHRRNKFRGAPATLEKLNYREKEGKIELITNYQLHDLIGNDGMISHVVVQDLSGNTKQIEADILLPFFGLSQDLGPILEFGLNVRSNHILVETPYFNTSIDGIYAIGDVVTYEGKLKLILTSFAEASSALHHAYSKVFDGKSLHFEYSTTKGIKQNNQL
jgi:thioredoxin reductase (NADPH)